MCKMLAIALLLVLLVYGTKGGIYIDIVASSSLSNANVFVSGEITEIIPDEELATWRLSDNQLKDFVLNYSGVHPDDVFIKNPTPKDLYLRNGWHQVERTLVPTSAKILAIVPAEPQLVYDNYFFNNDSTATSYTVRSYNHKVEQKVYSSWTVNGKLQIEQPISYNVSLLYDGGFGTSHIDFDSKWGELTTHSKTITINPRNTMRSVKIIPGQDVKTKITLYKRIIKVQVDYMATLNGIFAYSYKMPYNDNTFWGRMSVSQMLMINEVPYTIKSTEIIRIVFYPLIEMTIANPNPKNKQQINVRNFLLNFTED